METTMRWPWKHTLAMARPGQTLKVEQILFESVQHYCGAMGIQTGTTLTCTERDDHDVAVVLPVGTALNVARQYAWFVGVQEI